MVTNYAQNFIIGGICHVILGLDFLERSMSYYNFKKGEIKIGKNLIKLKPGGCQERIFSERVTIVEDMEVPGEHEIVCQVQVQANEGAVVFSNQTPKTCIIMARVVAEEEKFYLK